MSAMPLPDRRSDDHVVASESAASAPAAESAVRRIVTLLRDEQVTTYVRILAIPLATMMVWLGYQPVFEPDAPAYDRPVFRAVFAFASPQAWGVGFMVCAALMMVTALSGRLAVYAVAVALSAVTLAGWASMICYEAWWGDNGAELTSGAVGLYVGSLTAIVGLALSPHQVEAPQQIVAVVNGDRAGTLRAVE